MVLRAMTRADEDLFAALEEQIFPEDPWTRGMISEELASPRSHYFAAVADERVVGYAGVSVGLDADVMTMGTVPDWRGRGVGALLMHAVVGCAREHGAERIFLEVRESNEAARRLYERSGFETVGRIRGYFRSPREDAISMRLVL